MKKQLYRTALLVGATLLLLPGAATAQTKEKAPKWTLIWKHDFNKDSILDPEQW